VFSSSCMDSTRVRPRPGDARAGLQMMWALIQRRMFVFFGSRTAARNSRCGRK